jgi:hypothetical protein
VYLVGALKAVEFSSILLAADERESDKPIFIGVNRRSSAAVSGLPESTALRAAEPRSQALFREPPPLRGRCLEAVGLKMPLVGALVR